MVFWVLRDLAVDVVFGFTIIIENVIFEKKIESLPLVKVAIFQIDHSSPLSPTRDSVRHAPIA